MKCFKPGTDQIAEFTVFVDGKRCSEFVLPEAANPRPHPNPNTLECFVPVWDAGQISVEGVFQGSVLNACIDLVVDGAYVGDKRTDPGADGEVKWKRRNVKFSKVYDLAQITDTSEFTTVSDRVVEGNLYAQTLDIPIRLNSHVKNNRLNLGMLAVVVSINQNEEDNYSTEYKAISCGQWKHNGTLLGVGNGGIMPTHTIITKTVDNKVSEHRRRAHARHLKQGRFGTEAWARFIFYYRSRKAIDEVRCVTVPSSHSFNLPPVSTGTFIRALPAPIKKKEKKVVADDSSDDHGSPSDSRERRVSQSSSAGSYGGPFAKKESIPTPKKQAPMPMPLPPQAKKPGMSPYEKQRLIGKSQFTNNRPAEQTDVSPKKKLMGQSLNLPPGFKSSTEALPVTGQSQFEEEFVSEDDGLSPGLFLGPDSGGLEDTSMNDVWGDLDEYGNPQTFDWQDAQQESSHFTDAFQPPYQGLQTPSRKELGDNFSTFNLQDNTPRAPTAIMTTSSERTQQASIVPEWTSTPFFHAHSQAIPSSAFTPTSPPVQQIPLPGPSTPANSNPLPALSSSNKRSAAATDDADESPSKRPRVSTTDHETTKAELLRQVEERKRRKASLLEREAKRKEMKRLRDEEEVRKREEAQAAEIEALRQQLADEDAEIAALEREGSDESADYGSLSGEEYFAYDKTLEM